MTKERLGLIVRDEVECIKEIAPLFSVSLFFGVRAAMSNYRMYTRVRSLNRYTGAFHKFHGVKEDIILSSPF